MDNVVLILPMEKQNSQLYFLQTICQLITFSICKYVDKIIQQYNAKDQCNYYTNEAFKSKVYAT